MFQLSFQFQVNKIKQKKERKIQTSIFLIMRFAVKNDTFNYLTNFKHHMFTTVHLQLNSQPLEGAVKFLRFCQWSFLVIGEMIPALCYHGRACYFCWNVYVSTCLWSFTNV